MYRASSLGVCVNRENIEAHEQEVALDEPRWSVGRQGNIIAA
jgi:hypothetical protein